MMKKSGFLVGAITVLLLFCALGAQDKAVASESGGISWSYESGVLTLTGEGEMTDVSVGGTTPWQQYASLTTELRIGKGITSVGDRSFYGFTALRAVTLADSINEIGAHAFSGCISLETVQYPAYLKAVGEGAFNGCSSLVSVVLPSSCRSLGEYAYAFCTSLKSANLPATLSEIGAYAFFGATALESVQLPATLDAIPESCFRACASLSAVSLPTLLTRVGDYAFFGCASLRTLPLPEEITEVGAYAFAESGLTSLNLPSKVGKIGAYALSSCTNLVNLTLPKTLKTIPDGLCFSCKKLEKIEFPTTLESIGADAFSYCLALKELTLPSNLRSIGAHAFAYANSLEKLTFQSVNCFVAGSTASPVFRACVALSEVTFGAEVSRIPDALCYGLTGLERVSMGNSVREIGISAFEGCTSLAAVHLSSSLGRVGESAFYRCQSLKSLYLPESITVAGRYAFFTDADGRLFLESERAPVGFADGWRGESAVYYAGEWVKCSFDAQGKTLAELYLPLGESVTEPTVDSYEPRKGYTAYFSGWDLNGDGNADSIPLQNWQSFRAVALFREIPNKYLCRFFDDDGTLLAEYSLYYDTEITLPTPPTKASDGLYEYYFSSWNGYREGMTVEGDHDFTAVYQAVLLDLKAPFALGIENGEVYYAPRDVEIGDEGGLLSVTLDGVAQNVNLGKAHLTLPADGKSHRIVALDEAGWELVIEVRGVNIFALIDAMPEKDAAVPGAEEELLRVFEEIDSLLTKAITENDRIALQARRAELFGAYRQEVAKNAFSVTADADTVLTEEMLKKAFLPLFGEEETRLTLEGHTVNFEICVRAVEEGNVTEALHLLADSQGKSIKDSHAFSVFRAVTSPDGMKKKEEVTAFQNVTFSLRFLKEELKGGLGFLLGVGDQAEHLTVGEDGSLLFAVSTPFTLTLIEEPANGLSFRTLLFLAVGVSLITSLSLAFFARYLVRRRASGISGLQESVNADTGIGRRFEDDFESQYDAFDGEKGEGEETEAEETEEAEEREEGKAVDSSYLDELYAPSEDDLETEGFSLHDGDETIDFEESGDVSEASKEDERAE